MMKFYKYIIFVIVLVIIREMYVSLNNNPTNSYVNIFILFFSITYLLTKNLNLSLFTGLIVFIFRTIYRYLFDVDTKKFDNNNRLLFTLVLLFPYLIYLFKKSIDIHKIKLANFGLIIYILFSTGEYIIHKYVMHGKLNNNIKNIIKKIPILGFEYFDAFYSHIQHHKETNDDMIIDEPKRWSSLYMDWKVSLFLIPVLLLAVITSKKISNYNIKFKNIIILSVIVSIIWQYIWNKVHVHMHELEQNYSILKGPYDENLFDLTFIKNLLLKNHSIHHLQKGIRKGNYNVIALGADEWFNKNNKIVKNN